MEFKKKETTWIIVSIIILTFIIGFATDSKEQTAEIIILTPLIISILIILTTIITKKIAAPFYNIKIEHEIWKLQTFAFYKRSHFKKPFPIGLILPFFLTIVSLGIIGPMTLLQFNVKNIPEKRILRKRGGKRYVRKEHINDSDPAFTAIWAFYSLIILAIIGALINFQGLTESAILYGLWNLIPFGQLDGSKVFFGSFASWVTLLIVYLASLLFIGII